MAHLATTIHDNACNLPDLTVPFKA